MCGSTLERKPSRESLRGGLRAKKKEAGGEKEDEPAESGGGLVGCARAIGQTRSGLLPLPGGLQTLQHQEVAGSTKDLHELNKEATLAPERAAVRLAAGGPKPPRWSWADEQYEEDALLEGEAVQVPAAPLEAPEPVDELIAHGEKLGSEGRGRAPLNFGQRRSSSTPSRSEPGRVHEVGSFRR